MDAGMLSVIGAVALAGVALIGVVDGVWVHLVRERLHAHEETRHEHWVHTGRAVAMVPILMTVTGSAVGWLLWVGIGFLVVDQFLELYDVAIERRSRQGLGGLSSSEMLLHAAAISLRSVAVLAALALRPAEAYALGAVAPVELGALALVSKLLLGGAVLIAAGHVLLGLRPGTLPMWKASTASRR